MDLNADLAEGFGVWRLGDDEAMLGIVTSANLACGFHAGDPAGLRVACRQAAAAGVCIGAQVGYRDLAGFGRRYIDVSTADGLATLTSGLTAGVPVKVFGIPQADGTLKAYVLAYYTGMLPSI